MYSFLFYFEILVDKGLSIKDLFENVWTFSRRLC